ncbi:hypothetical protein [Xenophilus sp. Marseille-Q4582]|uniref:hypothetical protein n=1 Tax=Xenophilus sp. Marseille-Q4582 TaxID=2866600 RepID=UPI001CE435C9|nr:hypothetical protein [Xenophilus sp. Marseille-Q4582]
MHSTPEIQDLVRSIKTAAVSYQERFGRALGVTGELAELQAALLLGLELAPPRCPGVDAYEETPSGRRSLQIKSRRVLGRGYAGERIGKLGSVYPSEAVLLVLVDAGYEVIGIWEADFAKLVVHKDAARGIPVSAFIRIARRRWAP